MQTTPKDSRARRTPHIDIRSGNLIRRLERTRNTVVTTQFIGATPSVTVRIKSDEFGIRTSSGHLLTAHDYTCDGVVKAAGLSSTLTYKRLESKHYPPGSPLSVSVTYQATKTSLDAQSSIRKSLLLTFPAATTHPQSVEVERFTTATVCTRGGRGEPVVIANRWILLPQNPTMLTRHTDGNQPTAYGHHFEKVGNHSFVNYEGADIDSQPMQGRVRCFHFPLLPSGQGAGSLHLISQAIDLLLTPVGSSPEQHVIDIVRPAATARALTHYNNWFDPNGKNVSGDNLPKIHRSFVSKLAGSRIRIDAIVPDNGWQNRQSVWEPDLKAFPNGMKDLKQLGSKLQSQNTSLGLWFAVNGTANDIRWGVSKGYEEAKPSAYFAPYAPYYSLARGSYLTAVTKQLVALTDMATISYFKFDFNHLSHTVPTDRHGHEAEMLGYISATQYPREKGVFINATNWTWHAPGWLNYANTVWLLAGDDGFNANWPDLSGRAQASTDRDTFFWRMWGNPSDRPWFPIASIMTHGIIRNSQGQMSLPTDTLRDWRDYLIMHYGRGTLLREWYLSPDSVTAHEWTDLKAIHMWADQRRSDLIHTCYVGGRPDEGHVYGYMGWSKSRQSGTLVARNPSAAGQTLKIPLDQATFFRGIAGQSWTAKYVYPYVIEASTGFTGGQIAEIFVPGYETIAVEFRPGRAIGPMVKKQPDCRVTPDERILTATVKIEPFVTSRRELLVIGYPKLPEVLLNGMAAQRQRHTTGALNQFASYAEAGMRSDTARAWEMASYDVSSFGSTPFHVQISGIDEPTRAEAWLLTEVEWGGTRSQAVPGPLTHIGTLRSTTPVFDEARIPEITPTDNRIRAQDRNKVIRVTLKLEAFGINPNYPDKIVSFNGKAIGLLPSCSDRWEGVAFDLPVQGIRMDSAGNQISVTTQVSDDKFKVRYITLEVHSTDGQMSRFKSRSVFTSHRDWPYFEGLPFGTDMATGISRSPTVVLVTGLDDER